MWIYEKVAVRWSRHVHLPGRTLPPHLGKRSRQQTSGWLGFELRRWILRPPSALGSLWTSTSKTERRERTYRTLQPPLYTRVFRNNAAHDDLSDTSRRQIEFRPHNRRPAGVYARS